MQPVLAAPRDDLTESVVRDALSLRHGPRIRHGVEVLDNKDRLTEDRLPWTTGSVTWAYRPPDTADTGTAAAEVRRRAQLTVSGPHEVDLNVRRFRPWTELQASTGEWPRFYLGVFVATNPGRSDDGILVRSELDLADKTYLYANSQQLTNPVTIAAGVDPVAAVRFDLAATYGETFDATATTVTLAEPKFFPAGTSRLAYYNALLELAGYDQITVDVYGRPRSVPLATITGRGPEVTYGPDAGRIVTPGDVDPLLPTLPNVVRFVARQGPTLPEEGNGIVTKRNESVGPASVDARSNYSTDPTTRARAEVFLEVQVAAENQAELAAVAAADAQRYFAGGGLRFSGRVGLNPRHDDRDVIELDKPRLKLGGEWLVTSWTYPLERIVSESAVTMAITAEARV